MRDGFIGFDNELLIAGLAYVLDSSGQRTEIKVGPMTTYLTKPEIKEKADNWADVKK